MGQHYSNPKRANDPYALPDVETFQCRYGDCPRCGLVIILPDFMAWQECSDTECNGRLYPAGATENGWFWWSCFPGCLPDGEPNGPFATEEEAVADAQAGVDDNADGDSDDDEFESECSECCADTGATHVITTSAKSRCMACGYSSHHYLARVTVLDSGEAYAAAVYSGADDPAANFPDVYVSKYGPADGYEVGDGDEVMISWCCGAPQSLPAGTDELPQCVQAMKCYCAGHARGNPASEPCDTSEEE